MAKNKASSTATPAKRTPPARVEPVEPSIPATTPADDGKIAHPQNKATRHLRAPIEIRVEITARSQSFTTTSRNIAIGGISFESSQEFRVGDLVNVLLYIPVKKELDLLKVASEVVWVEDLSGSWMAGAAFRKFAPGDERRLRAWLLESVRAQRAGQSI
ncbi:MAG: PilZ domain-containing protein [Deltaproteobacteria bacterium]|nr:PilZ domain-containing protein [Deltaproteobacteria bacterium]